MRARRPFPGPLVLAFACLAACGDAGGDRPLNALLVTLDTTRADALSCYGVTKGVTPHLDRLAAEGVLYERAYTVAPLTLPAHASMLTGLYPIRHGVRENGLWPLAASADTLAEGARAAGYDTAAFLAAVVLDAPFGLDQGFVTYDAPGRSAEQTTSHYTERNAREVVDAALEWLDSREDERPFFLWVHFFDPHSPLQPPEEFRQGRLASSPYLGEVAFVDAEVGRLMERLRADDLLEQTYVAVVGDHGEAFGEHGEVSHGPFCYDSTLRIPFLVRDPGADRAGLRSAELVSVVDVHPTLADAMGLASSSGIDGNSLFRRSVPADRGLYFESYTGYLSLGWSPLAGWLDADGKYLHSSDPQFFDLARDPVEGSDLLASGGGPDVRPYQLAIAEVSSLPRLEESAAALDEDVLDDLRGLGYTTVGAPKAALPDPLAPSDRPSPQAKAREHYDTLEALERFNTGDVAGAHAVFARIVRENPRNSFVLDLYAYSLMRQGRHAEAIEPLERLLDQGPERADSRFNLGVCLTNVGRMDEAAQALQRALELDPEHAGATRSLVQVLEAQGRTTEAQAWRVRLRELGGDG